VVLSDLHCADCFSCVFWLVLVFGIGVFLFCRQPQYKYIEVHTTSRGYNKTITKQAIYLFISP
jgi:hypothetical protein